MKRLDEELSNAYEIKTQRLGLGVGRQREGNVFNRMLRATEAGWEVEADPRHAELVIEQLGLDAEKAVATPWVLGSDEDDLTEVVASQLAAITLARTGQMCFSP